MKYVVNFIQQFIDDISNVGVSRKREGFSTQSLKLTNLFSFNLSFMMLITALVGALFHISPMFLTVIRFLLVLIYLVPLFLNHYGKNRTARFYMVISPPLMLLGISWVAGLPDVVSLRAALYPAVLLPVILYGIQSIPQMLLGIGWFVLIQMNLDRISYYGGFIPGIETFVFTNRSELVLNGVISFFLILEAFLIYQVLLLQSERAIQQERERADALLENILPEEIIPILKRNPSVIADHFEGTSILFADIVGFTKQAAEIPAHDLVRMLNDIFSYFDMLVEKHGLEKIKTIGDCYMAAAGVPKPRTDHAIALVDMALEAQGYISKNMFNNQKLSLRVGIASGPVIAGVIGQKKFIYDLWGDTVNTASRMESHGEAGCVQITEQTLELVEPYFQTRKMGDVDVKGKGVMPIYQVTGRKGITH